MSKDQVFHDKTKDIDMRYHFIRTKERIKMKKIGTTYNPADMLTKPVPACKFSIAWNYSILAGGDSSLEAFGSSRSFAVSFCVFLLDSIQGGDFLKYLEP